MEPIPSLYPTLGYHAGMRESPTARVRLRLLAIAMLVAGAAFGLWLARVLIDRGGEIDERGIAPYSLPTDYLLGTASALLVVVGGILLWRVRD